MFGDGLLSKMPFSSLIKNHHQDHPGVVLVVVVVVLVVVLLVLVVEENLQLVVTYRSRYLPACLLLTVAVT